MAGTAAQDKLAVGCRLATQTRQIHEEVDIAVVVVDPEVRSLTA